MHKISGNSALDQYLATTRAQSQKAAGTPFQQLLASATASASVSPTGVITAASAISAASMPPPSGAAKFVSDLNAALSAYGISTPPALRISSGPNGLQLSDDDRNAQFQAMLKNNPALGQSLNDMLGTATANRKAALSSAMQSFGGKNPSPTTSDFLNDFDESEQPQGLSVSFNGASASVDELDAQGWTPVKGQSTFSGELLAAYAKYLVKDGVSVEQKKDNDGSTTETDADIDLTKKLAAAAAG
jgi:hypothetical protein